jgi:hypothetical protein
MLAAAAFACAAFMLSPHAAVAEFAQQGSKLVGTPDIPGSHTEQGRSVALSADGNTLLVGGNESVWVFVRSGTSWTEQQRLVATDATVNAFQSVALSADGNTAIIGDPSDNNGIGAAFVFTRSGGTWSQQGSKLVANDYDDSVVSMIEQGTSVAVSADGNTALVGGPSDARYTGAVWVFTRSGGTWSQQGSKLVANDYDNFDGQSRQGTSVALSADGNTAIFGGSGDNGTLGAVWVFTRSGATWTQQGSKLVGNDYSGTQIGQGSAVALSADGNTAIFSGTGDNGNVGAAWVFTRSGGAWSQQGGKLVGSGYIVGTGPGIYQGTSVALSGDGNTAIIGGPYDSRNILGGRIGAVWAFTRSGSTWSQQGQKLVANDYTYVSGGSGLLLQGQSVALSGDGNNLAFGAPYDEDGIGAAWVFTDFSTTTTLSSSANPSVYGQPVTFTATVVSSGGGTPTGTVTFKRGAATLGTSALSGGVATHEVSSLAVQTYGITAFYNGVAGFTGSTSSTLVQTVNQASTRTTVVARPSPGLAGEPVVLTARVRALAPSTRTATGTVTFQDGSTTLGNANLAQGAATLKTVLAIGGHTISARYQGTSSFEASDSAAATEIVSAALGAEGRVNTTAANANHPLQEFPKVAALTGKRYVVVWENSGANGAPYSIGAQLFTATGAKAGAEFHANSNTAGIKALPAVAGLSDGGFVVAWQSQGQDGSGYGIYAQRFSNRGVKVGGEFRVNTTTAGNQQQPTIAGLNDGGFIVAWASPDRSGYGIYAKRYDTSGAAAGGEFRVNATAAATQQQPTVARLVKGGFVVAWESLKNDGSGYGIYAQRYDNFGNAAGAETQINTTTARNQVSPSIANLSDGGFLVAWASQGQDGSGNGIYGRRFNVRGAPAGGEFRVNMAIANNQTQPSVAGFDDGGFVVVWASAREDGSGYGVYARCYDAKRRPVDVAFRLNTTIAMNQWQPSVAAFSNGGFFAAWTSQDAAGTRENIYGQRFMVAGIASAAANSWSARRGQTIGFNRLPGG